jgi:hypothetical protein
LRPEIHRRTAIRQQPLCRRWGVCIVTSFPDGFDDSGRNASNAKQKEDTAVMVGVFGRRRKNAPSRAASGGLFRRFLGRDVRFGFVVSIDPTDDLDQ